jgi:uncharacterized protein YbjT (DUF2867 family)
MADTKLIAVMGATGAQGGGLVKAILDDPDGGFSARAITRNADSDKAKELAAAGAEVVQADLDDPASIERAFEGAHGAYCVTFFWEHLDADKEIGHAKVLAEAAKAAGVPHVIWSTLDDTRELVPVSDDRMPTLQGKYKVPHFDAKGEANKQFTDLDLPVTLLHTVFYWDNMIYFGMGPARGEDGVLAITFPLGDAKMPSIAAEDIGNIAYGIFKRGDEFIRKSIGVAGEHVSGSDMAAALSEVLGEEVRYNDVPPEVYRGFGFPGADDVGNMFQFKRDFEDQYRASRDVELARSLDPGLHTFKAWAEENKDRIPIQG